MGAKRPVAERGQSREAAHCPKDLKPWVTPARIKAHAQKAGEVCGRRATSKSSKGRVELKASP